MTNGLDGNRILITGGTGSLGRELVTALAETNEIVVYSRNEERQFALREELTARGAAERVALRIGDVRDTGTLAAALRGCDVAIHAAAMKDVLMCEAQPTQTCFNNIDGSRSFLQAVERAGVKIAVGVSTDKAADPTNVYGMTKYIMERLFVETSRDCPGIRFTCTRFGNMIDSSGSLISVWKKNPEADIRVTHPEATRFFFRVSDAVQTVVDAAVLGGNGEILVPKMKTARILDIIRLITGRDEIESIGLFPGEKLHEDLVGAMEAAFSYEENGYFVIRPGRANPSPTVAPVSSATAEAFPLQELDALIHA
jgi:UDP-N-acetylglucosamine 4,6-dehydratase/5-epimerase